MHTPPIAATGEVWQQCLGDYAHTTYCFYRSSVAAILGWLRPHHILRLQEQCGNNAWVITPTPHIAATGSVWQQCLGDYAHTTYCGYRSSVAAILGWLLAHHLLRLQQQCGSILHRFSVSWALMKTVLSCVTAVAYAEKRSFLLGLGLELGTPYCASHAIIPLPRSKHI